VAAGLDAIELVAAARAVLGGPKIAGDGMERDALGVAVAVAPDRGQRAGSGDMGIVGRHAAVVVDAVDFAIGAGQILGLLLGAAVSDREEKITVLKNQPGAKVHAALAVEGGRSAIDLLLVHPRAVAQPAAHDGGHRDAVLAGITEAEINPTVVGMIRMHADREQTALPPRPDRRRAAHGLGLQSIRTDDAQPPRTLGDQQTPVRQPSQRPGRLQSRRHRFQPIIVQLAGRDRVRRGRRDLRLRIGGALGGLADIDHQAPHGRVVQHRAKPRHTVVGRPATDDARQRQIVGAVPPDAVNQTGSASALQFVAMTGRAELRVEPARVGGGPRGRTAKQHDERTTKRGQETLPHGLQPNRQTPRRKSARSSRDPVQNCVSKRAALRCSRAMSSKPIPGSTGEVLTCLPSPYRPHAATGLLYLPRFLAKCAYVKTHRALPKSYAKNYKRGLDRFLCLHLGIDPAAVEKIVFEAADDDAIEAGLRALLPADVKAEKWNRELVQKGMTDAGREFLAEALTNMGCADRIGQIISVPDLIDFDEGRID